MINDSVSHNTLGVAKAYLQDKGIPCVDIGVRCDPCAAENVFSFKMEGGGVYEARSSFYPAEDVPLEELFDEVR